MSKNISIVTISQWSRRHFIKNLVETINNINKNSAKDDGDGVSVSDSNSPYFLEWVIVNGTIDVYDAEQYFQYLNNLKTRLRPEIKFKLVNPTHLLEPARTIGRFREISNRHASGDIIIAMDDDDYYSPGYVDYVVSQLDQSGLQLAGCTRHYLYDFDLDLTVQFNGFGNNHTINCFLAYTKEYAETHHYDVTATNAEEKSFLNNFREPMVQLDPDRIGIQLSHEDNTYNKRAVILNSLTSGLSDYGETSCRLVNRTLKDFIIGNSFSYGIKKQVTPLFNIVYYCGLGSIVWNPSSDDLGGSEQAVVNLSEEWQKMGRSVAVYGNFPFRQRQINNVDYFHSKYFKLQTTYEVLILWRLFGITPFFQYGFTFKAKYLAIDLHDNLVGYHALKQYLQLDQSNINSLMFKSEFHQLSPKLLSKVFFPDQVKQIIIPNGLRINEFETNQEGVWRNPYRFCYVSCYTRGLIPILRYIWPKIYEFEPRSEFHIYYGTSLINNPEILQELSRLLAQPGVCDHSRQSVKVVARERYLSTWHLYYTNSLAEIDCISIRESCLAGCIPIISDCNLFGERIGIHIPWREVNKDNDFSLAIDKIKELISMSPENIALIRDHLTSSNELSISWKTVAERWLETFPISTPTIETPTIETPTIETPTSLLMPTIDISNDSSTLVSVVNREVEVNDSTLLVSDQTLVNVNVDQSTVSNLKSLDNAEIITIFRRICSHRFLVFKDNELDSLISVAPTFCDIFTKIKEPILQLDHNMCVNDAPVSGKLQAYQSIFQSVVYNELIDDHDFIMIADSQIAVQLTPTTSSNSILDRFKQFLQQFAIPFRRNLKRSACLIALAGTTSLINDAYASENSQSEEISQSTESWTKIDDEVAATDGLDLQFYLSCKSDSQWNQTTSPVFLFNKLFARRAVVNQSLDITDLASLLKNIKDVKFYKYSPYLFH